MGVRETEGPARGSLRIGAAYAVRRLSGLVRRHEWVGAVPTEDGMIEAVAVPGRSGPRVTMPGAGGARAAQSGRAESLKISIPRRHFLARDLTLPSADPRELDGMIPFELADLFPVDLEELSWDWHLLEITPEGYARVRVVAAETAEMEKHLAPFEGLVQTALSVEPSTVSVANLFCAANGGWPDEPVAIVSKFSDGMDFVVAGPCGIMFDRGVQPDTGDDSATAAAVAASLSIFSQGAGAGDVSRLLVWGEDDGGELARAISAETGIEVESAVLPDFAEPSGGGAAEAAACGAAIGGLLENGVDLALVPRERKRIEDRSRRAGSAMLTAALVAVTVALAWGALTLRSRRLSAYVERLEERAAAMAPEADQIDAKRQRLAAIKRQLTGRNRVLDLLIALYKITPPDISLTSLELDQDGLLTLKGHAQEMYRVSEYAQILEESDSFGKPAQQGPASFQRTEGGRTYISFTILRDLSGAN